MNEMGAKNLKTLVFANSIEHADTIAEALIADGYNAVSYHSKVDKYTDKLAIEWYKNNDIKCSLEDYIEIYKEAEEMTKRQLKKKPVATLL
jgi:superfamily II DNA/RNA helicase